MIERQYLPYPDTHAATHVSSGVGSISSVPSTLLLGLSGVLLTRRYVFRALLNHDSDI